MNDASSEQLSESLRGHESLSEVEDFNALATKYIEHGETIKTLQGDIEGKVKASEGMIKIPDENSSDEDRKAYHTKMGRPETVDKYAYERPTVPEGMTYNEKLFNDMKQVMFDAGVSDTAFTSIIGKFDKIAIANHSEVQELISKEVKEDQDTLKSLWPGETFEQNTKRSDDFLDKVLDKMGTDIPEKFGGAHGIKEEFKILGFVDNSNPKLRWFMSKMFDLIGDDHFTNAGSGGGDDGSKDPETKKAEEFYKDSWDPKTKTFKRILKQ